MFCLDHSVSYLSSMVADVKERLKRLRRQELSLAIITELKISNYHTLRQFSDIIENKVRLPMSVTAVGSFLKKGHKTHERLTIGKS